MAALKDSFFFSIWAEKRVSGTPVDLAITLVSNSCRPAKKLRGLLFQLI